MATRETEDSSDEIIDNKCSVCVGKNITRKAEKYCVECQDYYCIPCTDTHKAFPALRSHKLLDKSDFKTQGTSTSLPSYPTERCPIHKAKLLDIFCENHDEVICATCVAINHRSCVTVHSIPDEVETLYKQPVSDQISKDLMEEKQQFADIKQRKLHLLSDLEKQKKKAIDLILNYKTDLEDELKRLVRDTIKQIEAEYGRIERNVQDAIDVSNDYIKEFEQFEDKIQISYGNKAQEFVSIKAAQKIIRMAGESKEMLKGATCIQIVPEVDTSIAYVLRQKKVLANLLVTENKAKPRTTAYTVKQHSCISARMDSDSTDWWFYHSCLLEDASLLVTDICNKKLKRIDTSKCEITDHLILEDGPFSVCQTGKQAVAVSLNNSSIAFVSLGNKMVITRKLKMNHNCKGLAYTDNKLFISDGGSAVYVHDINGRTINKITNDTSQQIFQSTLHLTPSTSRNFLYVCDDEKGLITLDMQGNYVSTFVDDNMISQMGVCTDSRGNIYVCSNKSSTIIQIKEDSMTKISVIETDRYPCSVCFDPNQNKLFVTHYGIDSVNVYTL